MVIFFIFLIVILFIIGCFVLARKTNNIKKDFSAKLKAENFIESKKIDTGANTLFVDDISNRWCIKVGWQKEPRIYNYSDLIEFEVYEDGESIAKGRTGSAIVGGLLFGVVGAVVGGARSKDIQSTCTVLQLRIRVNDLNNPEIVVDFISAKTEKSSVIYKNSFESAKNMAATLSYIQNQVQSV